MPPESWRYLDPESGLVVSIAPSMLRLFEGSRQQPWQRERGGVLFAESVGTDGHLEICDATAPHAHDRAGWNWLTLDHQRCLVEISDRFTRGLHFVGYWHTHPERTPRPSARDITALQRNLIDGGIPLQKLIAVIVGTDRAAAGLYVATVSRSNFIPSIFLPERVFESAQDRVTDLSNQQ